MVATFDLSFFHVVFFPSCFRPLALWRRGGIVVDWCLGRMKSSSSSKSGHPSPSQSSSPAVPPLFAKAWGWGSLFSVWSLPLWASSMVEIHLFHVVFFPSFFWPLALQRKGGTVVDWCSERMKSNASSQGGHPSPSRSSSPSIPPFLWRHGAWEACSLFEPSPCELVATFDLYLFHLVFFPSSFWSLDLWRKGVIVVD